MERDTTSHFAECMHLVLTPRSGNREVWAGACPRATRDAPGPARRQTCMCAVSSRTVSRSSPISISAVRDLTLTLLRVDCDWVFGRLPPTGVRGLNTLHSNSLHAAAYLYLASCAGTPVIRVLKKNYDTRPHLPIADGLAHRTHRGRMPRRLPLQGGVTSGRNHAEV